MFSASNSATPSLNATSTRNCPRVIPTNNFRAFAGFSSSKPSRALHASMSPSIVLPPQLMADVFGLVLAIDFQQQTLAAEHASRSISSNASSWANPPCWVGAGRRRGWKWALRGLLWKQCMLVDDEFIWLIKPFDFARCCDLLNIGVRYGSH